MACSGSLEAAEAVQAACGSKINIIRRAHFFFLAHVGRALGPGPYRCRRRRCHSRQTPPQHQVRAAGAYCCAGNAAGDPSCRSPSAAGRDAAPAHTVLPLAVLPGACGALRQSFMHFVTVAWPARHGCPLQKSLEPCAGQPHSHAVSGERPPQARERSKVDGTSSRWPSEGPAFLQPLPPTPLLLFNPPMTARTPVPPFPLDSRLPLQPVPPCELSQFQLIPFAAPLALSGCRTPRTYSPHPMQRIPISFE
jgi:hypothetical protein